MQLKPLYQLEAPTPPNPDDVPAQMSTPPGKKVQNKIKNGGFGFQGIPFLARAQAVVIPAVSTSEKNRESSEIFIK